MENLIEQPTQAQLEVQAATDTLFDRAAEYDAHPAVWQGIKSLARTMNEYGLLLDVSTVTVTTKGGE